MVNTIHHYKPFLCRFALRRNQSTKWLGHPLIKLKPHIHRDIGLHNKIPLYPPQDITDFEATFQSEKDDPLAKVQERFDQEPEVRCSNIRPTQLAFNTLYIAQWRLSLLATFPWLLKLVAPEGNSPMKLTEIEALHMRGSDNYEKSSGYHKNLQSIVETSRKVLWLFEFIHSLESLMDVNGEEEKLIVITQFPQVAFTSKLVSNVAVSPGYVLC
jgi:hypothetical protein